MKQAKKKIFSAALAVILLLVCACPASAAADTHYIYITTTTDYPNGVFAVVTVNSAPDTTMDVPSVQYVHEQGRKQIFYASSTYSRTATASASLGYNASLNLGAGITTLINDAFRSHLMNDEGLAAAETCTVSAGAPFVLEATRPSGAYMLTMVFPGASVEKTVVGQTKFGFEVNLWEENIDYAPAADASYYELRLVE